MWLLLSPVATSKGFLGLQSSSSARPSVKNTNIIEFDYTFERVLVCSRLQVSLPTSSSLADFRAKARHSKPHHHPTTHTCAIMCVCLCVQRLSLLNTTVSQLAKSVNSVLTIAYRVRSAP